MQLKERRGVEGGGERITLVPESLDDLWHLAYVLEPGDLVAGDTHRRIQRNDDQMRDTGGEREHMFVTIDVEDVEFHKFSNRLRVSGTIADCSREDQLGLHHTLNVEEREEIEIEKVWKPDQIERLNEAVEATDQPEVAIATVEEGEAYIHVVAQYGIDEYGSFTGTTGKGEYSRSREELFDELGSALGHLDADAIILAGPGFTKQDALDYIEEEYPDLVSKITVVDTSAAGGRGVHEVLKRGAVEDVQEETRIAEESELIDELTEQMATDGKAAYGIEEVEKAVEFGAVEDLLILDERLRVERAGEGDWDVDVNDLVTKVERQGGSVTVFSHEFAPGEQLRNLGGIGAVLRYRLD
ncbi:mRNA surveillance protein pelota [Halobacterium litoreum]|uniref:Protein pelota homolog n=1 Tax=Halobacterium litoreum TaxID=2039234 RepID=A0ABD5NC99_9EURY|nr:mRNA surveillance protein pelota [Halobacterium litoreum]UHH14193.1 mRNA surveillance protein pelota [Halobacterium litoreum]